MTKRKKRVLVVGGGAAGMMAAIAARRQGAEVTILERNPRIGKKILATGNGRCNFTNINTDINCYQGCNPKFAYSVLANFGVANTIDFFTELGIAHKVEDFGKVFPMSDQASSILDVLRHELEEIGVKVICDAFVKDIDKKKGVFHVRLADGSTVQGDRVVVATGGKAMPASGSDGNGYELLTRLGHTLVDIFPALVQLKLAGTFFKQIQGVKFVGTAEILHHNRSVAADRGDILFANYGVSGPPILQISRKAGELLQRNEEAVLKITIIDTMSREQLDSHLLERFNSRPGKTVEFSLVGLVNKRLIPVLLKEAAIDLKKTAGTLSAKERARIVDMLTDWRFLVKGTKGWSSAQVTAGGINTDEINPRTMESKLVPGLFLAGEIVDIDGLCGGFNLQWAWSSGYVAGENAAS